VKFDGQDVNSVPELQEQVGKHRPGDKATVTYMRNGKKYNSDSYEECCRKYKCC